jgi:hypothetical protein
MASKRERVYKSEAIEFNGIIFRRYPESKRWADKKYYRPNATHIRNGVETLHREIWKSVNGPIPNGHHIHHKDGNSLNNDISNLECIPGNEHLSTHATLAPEWVKERQRNNLRAAQDKCNAWHSTDEGREWHSEHGKRTWEGRVPSKAICTVCGKEYETFFPERSFYCSTICNSKVQHERAKLRPAPEPKYVERICEQCGKPFQINKYYRARFCSYTCSGLAKRGKPRPRVRSDGR